MLKMTGEEREKWVFKEFMDSLMGILDESADISKACVVVHNVMWTTKEFLEKIDKDDALSLKGIWSDLEEFPKDEKRLKYSPKELLALDEEEKKAVEFYKDTLKSICRKILASDIPKMGPKEDPYAWPSDEKLRIWDNKNS